MISDPATSPAQRSANLFLWPRKISLYSPAFWRLPFEEFQVVHVLCEQGSLACILAHRRLLNVARVEYLIRRQDGSQGWVPASALRARNFELRLVQGGRRDDAQVPA